ncbi:MAG: tetratricopeptide repeat protein [Candidatus Marinimicrobia bacterium]|nr:tetratricopeptide repeat protein [Candidatus Neomarinimicrobiota bacterium]
MKTKTFSGTKVKTIAHALFKNTPLYIIPVICYWLTNCAPSIAELAEIDPEAVIAKKSELLADKSVSEETITAVVNAHNNLGDAALQAKDFDEAEKQFNESLALDSNSKQAKYGLAMIKGHRLFKKGSNSALWDSMEQFGKALYYNPTKGEPHYWMGRAYEKKDDGDFELIVEAYEKALIGTLSNKLKKDTEERLAIVKKQQKTFKEFWK